MSEFLTSNPTVRFSGLAAAYDRYRPGYPESVWELIVRQCGLTPGSRVVDVGCGTGISSRQLAALGLLVTGVEPNVDMLRVAHERRTRGLKLVEGRAESTGLPDGCADLVVAAQAFHWFHAEDALSEFRRILRFPGHVALLWNQLEPRDAFTSEYGAALRSASPEKAIAEAEQSKTGEALLRHPLFEDTFRFDLANQQSLDLDGLIGRALSVSFGPRSAESQARFVSALRELFERFARQEHVMIRYRTVLYLARVRRL